MKPSKLCAVFVCAAALLSAARVELNAEESSRALESGYPQSTAARNAVEGDEKVKQRWREGKRLINHGGHFRQDGDGAVFVSEKGHELVALANLNLERVTRTLKASDESESIRWSVNGVVTEFNGRNYLLIQRAVYKSASPPPVPEQILN
jgi:hypothetical protein